MIAAFEIVDSELPQFPNGAVAVCGGVGCILARTESVGASADANDVTPEAQESCLGLSTVNVSSLKL